ncbi:FtsK/SpoIIIE domain-containing protein [Paenibacillus lactis]|uniref:FtsK/SpoIIIE domain-containing protein n=1 Tax=Paenibacillus lactis TaxID=228574 RepID=UPI00203B1ADE|nr:FtsK/SpoIIIE domain-containing protein [Paenibacillus lactis]MCM3497661.1 FtsK/SpoIIIE domain-containing protein [Paenibacillus lactis]
MIGSIIGIGFICGSLYSLISSFSFSSFDLGKSFLSACKTLGLNSGDLLPMVNAQYAHAWGTRLLVGLPIGLPSAKFFDNRNAIAEALRISPDSLEMRYDDGLIIDIITQPMPTMIPYQAGTAYRVCIGTNKRGELRYYDFDGPYPHLLIAGISGGGKSVMLRSILTTLAVGTTSSLYLCDLKGGVELGIFRKLASVKGFATDLSEVLRVTTQIEAEMIRRYSVMAANGSQSWAGEKAVLVIDELADFKVRPADPDRVVKSAIKTKLTALSAKGRAAGVILVLATQRPSADVIDGLIKTNIAASICFRTRDATQSRIVLDHNGAADLPDIPGRLIFQTARDETLQAPFLSAEEAARLIAGLPQREEVTRYESNATQTEPMDGNFIEL